MNCTGKVDVMGLIFNCETNKPIASVSCLFDEGEFKPCELMFVM